MDRRAAGLLVVVVGLLAAVVVPAVGGRGIPGVAQPVPVPGPPAIGACVGLPFDTTFDRFGADSTDDRYPELGLGECDQAHVGEVVSVIAQPLPTKVTGTPDGGSDVEDRNSTACYLATGSFLGTLDPAGKAGPALFGYWGWVASPGSVPLMPTARQQAAGAKWLACVTYLVDQPLIGGESLVHYQGTLRDALSTGVGRDYLGYCPTEADWNRASSFSCARPHHGEVFGYTSVSQEVARTTLTASCAKLVERVTKNPDLVRDNQFVVSIQANLTGQAITGATIPSGSTVQCGVLANDGRMVQGSLIAIGTDPIPWA